MKYILIANNPNINDEIEKLVIDEQDEVVLFNLMVPYYKYEKVRNCKNLTVMIRKRGDRVEPLDTVYAGLIEVKQEYDKINRIIVHHNPACYEGVTKDATIASLSVYGLYDSDKVQYIIDNNFKKEIAFDGKGSLSSGLIAYLHYKKKLKEGDKIILVGFTNKIATAYHDKDFETLYFKKEYDLKMYEKV